MAIDRTTILRGPAILKWAGVNIFTKNDIEDDFGIDTFQPESSAHGQLDPRIDLRRGGVRATPVGQFTADQFNALWPYRTTLVGASIYGADVPLVLKTIAGKKHTYYAAAIEGMPEITFAAKETVFGQASWGIMGKNNVAWNTADSFRKIETEAFSDEEWATFDQDEVITEPAVINWATGGGGTAFKTVDGVKLIPDLQLEDVPTDDEGVVDRTLADVGIMARFRPLGQTEQEVMDMVGFQGLTGFIRGAKLITKAFDMTFTVSAGTLTIHNAALVGAGFRFGRTVLRNGELAFVSARSFTGGKRDPLWTFTAAS